MYWFSSIHKSLYLERKKRILIVFIFALITAQHDKALSSNKLVLSAMINY